jgi:general L-amino acid transport system ATP-binding protein
MKDEGATMALVENEAESSVEESPAIEMIGVHKWYGAFHVLRNIDLTVRRGERIVICGPSGSGKSAASTASRNINAARSSSTGSN